MNRYSFSHRFQRDRKQSSIRTELTFNRTAFKDRLLLMTTRFAKSIFDWSITVFVKSQMTIRTVENWIKLLVVGTQTASTSSLQHSLWVLPRFLTLLTLHVFLELLLVHYLLLLWLNRSILLD